jgi:glucosamine-6-phosphate deaminase
MELIIYDTYEELSKKTAKRIIDLILEKPDALLCFPAGETSIGTFNELARLNDIGKFSFKDSRIIGLDEWINLGEKKGENCYSFLKKHLFDFADFTEENICFFDGESTDPEKECQKTDEYLRRNGPIDMILLGLGMNGHVGLNEPGTSPELSSHLVTLDKTTKTVGKKYFEEEVNLCKGITIGLKQIIESKIILLQASGNKKSDIIRRLIHEAPSPDLPASLLKSHPNFYLLLDKEAAAQI